MDLEVLYDWFWSERFWLPRGYSWSHYKSNSFRQKAECKDLYIIPFLIIAVTLIRFIFERFIARPFCQYIGIQEERKFKPNEVLEKYYLNNKFPTNKDLNTLSNETGIKKSEIKMWFSMRRRFSKNILMKKATETCYRAVVYAFLFFYGSYVVLKTHWFWDNSQWLKNFIEEHEFTWDMKWYYFIEISFYFALLFSQFFDTRRKDFVQMTVHHFATLTLLLGSYIISLYRFGAVIMYIHDAADMWLESAKLANYAKAQKVCDTLFVVFALIFFVTRLIYYPIWVAHGYFNYNTYSNGLFHQLLVLICFLILFLNFYWGFLIARMAYRVAIVGKVEKDSRSDTEDED